MCFKDTEFILRLSALGRPDTSVLCYMRRSACASVSPWENKAHKFSFSFGWECSALLMSSEFLCVLSVFGQ